MSDLTQQAPCGSCSGGASEYDVILSVRFWEEPQERRQAREEGSELA